MLNEVTCIQVRPAATNTEMRAERADVIQFILAIFGIRRKFKEF
jgi:hypothetical protein